jgi:hypothetical protein
MKVVPKETPFSGSFGRKVVPLKPMKSSKSPFSGRAATDTPFYDIVEEEVFNRMLALERKRTERTGDTFVLMLVDCSDLLVDIGAENIERIGRALCSCTRDTDLAGWYEYPTKLAVLFTALCNEDRDAIRATLKEKTCDTLRELLEPEEGRFDFAWLDRAIDVLAADALRLAATYTFTDSEDLATGAPLPRRPRPPLALTTAEEQAVLDVLHVDKPALAQHSPAGLVRPTPSSAN